MSIAMPSATILAIHQLLGRYCHVLDARAWDRLPEIFAAQGVLDATSLELGIHDGIGAISAFWRTADHPVAHHVSAIVVEHGEAGAVNVSSKGFFAWPDGLSGGDYHDIAIRTDAGWRLLRRRYVRRWSLRRLRTDTP